MDTDSLVDRRRALAILAAAPFAMAAAPGPQPSPALQRWSDDTVQANALPGLIVAVRRPDGRVLSAAAGFSDVENRLPMRLENRLLGASMGKTFVSALCLKLQRRGVFSLDDKISTWLGREPWFPRLPNGSDLTLRMLLNHSSGLHDFIDEPAYGQARASTLRTEWVLPAEGKIALVLELPPLFPAGQGSTSSDTNYILVGMCVERATGSNYFRMIRSYFLEPLRLTRTEPALGRRLGNLAVGYTVAGGRYERFGLPHRLVEDGVLVYNPATEWTGGGLVTNPVDLVAWIHAVFSGQAVDPRDLHELERPARAADSGQAQYYGQGMKILNTPAGRLVGHWGSMAGYSGFVAHLAGDGSAIAFQTNLTAFDTLTVETSLAGLAATLARA